mmetsp:Transcript_25108/g.40726  ORF Transcript_25108/g.40726 Transcript_25108/m.40726 type:complete len:224 (+) Transcript_25108:182-853(+)
MNAEPSSEHGGFTFLSAMRQYKSKFGDTLFCLSSSSSSKSCHFRTATAPKRLMQWFNHKSWSWKMFCFDQLLATQRHLHNEDGSRNDAIRWTNLDVSVTLRIESNLRCSSSAKAHIIAGESNFAFFAAGSLEFDSFEFPTSRRVASLLLSPLDGDNRTHDGTASGPISSLFAVPLSRATSFISPSHCAFRLMSIAADKATKLGRSHFLALEASLIVLFIKPAR